MKKVERFRFWLRYAGAFCLAGAVLFYGDTGHSQSAGIGPKTGLHYAPNHNFDSKNNYLPGKAGFNLADAASVSQVNALKDGVKGLVWVGQCNGVDDRFLSTMRPFVGNSRVFGFFLMEDPDPRGAAKGNQHHPGCKADDLKAESDWVHTHIPGAKTFIILMNISSSKTPSFDHIYNPANTNIDLFGILPYPCRTELHGCDYDMIDRYIRAAESSGIPSDRIVPVYQAFGGGGWADDYQGRYAVPTNDQECHILSHWQQLIGAPVFDMTYSWGVQDNDIALEREPRLQKLFALRNREDLSACWSDVSERHRS